MMEDLSFSNILFTKHPKVASAWHHRRWVWEEMAGLELLTSHNHLLLQEELELSRSIADLYPKNYYAWIHRYWAFCVKVDYSEGEEMQV